MILMPGIDTARLEGVLTEIAQGPARIVGAVELGASSRATPWRIDVDVAGRRDVYVVRYGESVSRAEAAALRAMSNHPLPTPRVLYWDETGRSTGTPVFSLLPPMIAGDSWAIDLYIDTACALQAIGVEDPPASLSRSLAPASPPAMCSMRHTGDSATRPLSRTLRTGG